MLDRREAGFAAKEDSMGVIVLLGGMAFFCVLLWYFAVYALPVFVGFTTGFWALSHGAGIGCVAIGLVAGVAVFLAARLAFASANIGLRWIVVALFVGPAAWAGYGVVIALADAGLIASHIWRDLFAIMGALGVGGTAFIRLSCDVRGLPRPQTPPIEIK
jgi:hypothetical protein